jgi:hypothetical protein
VKFVATKKKYNNTFFSPLSFVAVFGSGMGKKPGSGINIPDPQHGFTVGNTSEKITYGTE